MQPLSIDLGDFRLDFATSLGDVVWLVLGMLILASLTALVIHWNRRARPDPFQ